MCRLKEVFDEVWPVPKDAGPFEKFCVYTEATVMMVCWVPVIVFAAPFVLIRTGISGCIYRERHPPNQISMDQVKDIFYECIISGGPDDFVSNEDIIAGCRARIPKGLNDKRDTIGFCVKSKNLYKYTDLDYNEQGVYELKYAHLRCTDEGFFGIKLKPPSVV